MWASSDKKASVSIHEVAPESIHKTEIVRRTDEARINVFKSPKAWWKQNYLSWRFYVTIYAGFAVLVCIINVLAVSIAAAVHGVDKGGRITLYEGSCGITKTSGFFAHLFVSGLGTCMLSASAYVMYCLAPPSREEIDREHAKGRWLDIGAMSTRNLMQISKKRSFLFLALGLSSPVLQFFFNSTLFQTCSTNAYTALVAQESFTKEGNITVMFSHNPLEAEPMHRTFGGLARHLHKKFTDGKLERLENKDCINSYAVPLQSNRRNVVVVTETDTKRVADVFDAYHAWIPTAGSRDEPEQYAWLCAELNLGSADQCLYHLQHLQKDTSAWTISNGARVKYCLSEKVPEHCKLQLSLQLCTIVTFICLFKAIVMFCVAFFVYETPLMTTGDAIVSFMARPDPYTKDMCMATKGFIQAYSGGWPNGTAAFYDSKPKRWWFSIKTRIIMCVLVMILTTCFSGALYCTMNESISFQNLLRLGIGSINRRFFISWHRKEQRGMFVSTLTANAAHAIFGMVYVLYNNVFYCMIIADEWSRYATHRKGLRVSESPRGAQRAVYFFLMPMKMAAPIMAFSSGIHTLISQTLFFVDVEAYGHSLEHGQNMSWYSRQPQYDFSTTGFSPLANVGLIAMSLLMIGFVIIMSAQKLKSGMPVVSTCSAAISAAIHPMADEDEYADLQPLQWGVTDSADGTGHCTFSAGEVKVPDEHTQYL